MVKDTEIGVVYHTKYNSMYLNNMNKATGKPISFLHLNGDLPNTDNVFSMWPGYRGSARKFDIEHLTAKYVNPEILNNELKHNVQELSILYRGPEILKRFINQCYLKNPGYYQDLTIKEKSDIFLNYYKSNRTNSTYRKADVSNHINQSVRNRRIIENIFSVHSELTDLKYDMLRFIKKCEDNHFSAYIKDYNGRWVERMERGILFNTLAMNFNLNWLIEINFTEQM